MKKLVLKAAFGLKSNFAPGHSQPECAVDNVRLTPFPGGAEASATISADFELAWAFRGRQPAERARLAETERRNVPLVVRLLDEYGIPITWATVGHLFLESCQCDPGGVAHVDMPRPPRNARWEGDWYKDDPCANCGAEPGWYCPDLIDAIRLSKTRHEIGSHSFSHIDFSPSTSTPELVRREIETCRRLMAERGLKLRSLVYPFNNMGHHYLDLLSGLGITAVRHRDARVRLSYPVRTPSGAYQLFESMNFRRAKYYDYAAKASIFLEEAQKRQAAYHIWFHPSDPTDLFEREFADILALMARKREAGRLWIATMGQLAAYCEARQQTSLRVHRRDHSLQIELSSTYDSKRYGEAALTLDISECPSPIRCEVTTALGRQSVNWSTGRAGILVTVPATASQLLLEFKQP